MSQPKHILRKTFNAVLIIGAYAFLAYTLLTFDDYPSLFAHFRSAGLFEWGCLLFALCLVPVNILCEAWKWRYLLHDLAPMDIVEAQRQVYLGVVGAFFTPERLGDYPTRVTRIEDKNVWLPAIALGFIGSMSLSTVNILGGTLSLLFSGITIGGVSRSTAFALAAALLLFFLVCIFLLPHLSGRLLVWYDKRHSNDKNIDAIGDKPSYIRSMLEALTHFKPRQFPTLVGMSLCRYLVYATQLVCALVFCGIELEPKMLLVIVPIHYFFVTLMPSVPAADAAVRGSVGALVFSYFTPNTAGVAIAAILLWLLNSMIPMFIGTFMRKK